MAVAGGLLPEENKLPEPMLHESYKRTGEDQFTFVKDGMEMAQVVEAKHRPADGFVVAQIESGDEVWDLGPVPVTVDTHTIIIPRNKPVLLPIQHFNALSDTVRTRYLQPDPMKSLVGRSSRRFQLRAIRWPKSANRPVDESIERFEVIEINQ